MKRPKFYEEFREWFLEKEHPHSRLNKNVFIHDLLKLVGFVIALLIIYSNIGKLNQITLLIIKIGSLLLLVVLFFTVRKGRHIFKNLKYWFRGFNHGTKLLIGIGIILLLLLAFFNQDRVVGNIISTYGKIEFNSFNPVKLEGLNFSLGSLNLSKNSLVDNPYQSVSIRELSQNGQKYVGKNISVSGNLVWRLGGYSLNANDDYWIWIEDNCIESQRNYNDGLHATSGRYTAKGLWLAPKPKQYSWELSIGMESNYRLKCTSPLE